MTLRFQQLDHTADLALRIYGRNRRELFVHAAYAMFCQLTELTDGSPSVERLVIAEGLDYESLLVNWLNELLYLHDTQGEVYSSFEIQQFSRQRLKAAVRGWSTRDAQTWIKAATYHQLAIERTAEGYEATIVFDI